MMVMQKLTTLALILFSGTILSSCGGSSSGTTASKDDQKGEGEYHNPYVSWELLTPTKTATPGEKFNLQVRLTVEDGVRLYTNKEYAESLDFRPVPMEVTVGKKGSLRIAGAITSDTPPVLKKDPNFDGDIEYWVGTVTLTIPVEVPRNADGGNIDAWVNVRYMTCTDKVCHPPSDFTMPLTLAIVE